MDRRHLANTLSIYNCVFSIVLLSAFPLSSTQLVYVNTSRGLLFGSRVDFGDDKTNLYNGQADIFLGIPYATAPLGVLRYQRTQRLSNFPASPYNATQFAPECPQSSFDSNGPQDEDCLYLNIFSPNASSISLYPVMVYIHGGGFVSGGTARMGVNGIVTNLVNRGVLVVNIQHRIGAVGFFTTHSADFPANRGFGDQIEALRWIQTEIAAFGGDPNRVTIFGQSSGAIAVSAHTLSPLSEGLFSAAIMESGSILTMFDGMIGFQNLSFLIANRLCGISQFDWNAGKFGSLHECFSNVSIKELVEAEAAVDTTGYYLSVDEFYLPELPQLLASRRPNIPVMMGTMQDEYATFLSGDIWIRYNGSIEHYTKSAFISTVNDALQEYVGDDTEKMTNIAYNAYGARIPPVEDGDHLNWLKATSDMLTGRMFTAPIARDAQWYLSNGNPELFIYEFTYATNIRRFIFLPGWKPAQHCDEVALLFLLESFWAPAIAANLTTPDDRLMADQLGELWTNFAKTRTPTPKWLPTTYAMPYQYYEIGVQSRMRESYREKDRLIWNQVLNGLIGDLPKLPTPSPYSFSSPSSGGSTTRTSRSMFLLLAIMLSPVIRIL